MKVSQIAAGSSYENKDSSQARKVEFIASETVFYVDYVAKKDMWRIDPSRRRRQMSRKEFADWAARPLGKKEDIGHRAVRLSAAFGHKH